MNRKARIILSVPQVTCLITLALHNIRQACHMQFVNTGNVNTFRRLADRYEIQYMAHQLRQRHPKIVPKEKIREDSLRFLYKDIMAISNLPDPVNVPPERMELFLKHCAAPKKEHEQAIAKLKKIGLLNNFISSFVLLNYKHDDSNHLLSCVLDPYTNLPVIKRPIEFPIHPLYPPAIEPEHPHQNGKGGFGGKKNPAPKSTSFNYNLFNSPQGTLWDRPCTICKSRKPRPRNQYICNNCKEKSPDFYDQYC